MSGWAYVHGSILAPPPTSSPNPNAGKQFLDQSPVAGNLLFAMSDRHPPVGWMTLLAFDYGLAINAWQGYNQYNAGDAVVVLSTKKAVGAADQTLQLVSAGGNTWYPSFSVLEYHPPGSGNVQSIAKGQYNPGHSGTALVEYTTPLSTPRDGKDSLILCIGWNEGNGGVLGDYQINGDPAKATERIAYNAGRMPPAGGESNTGAWWDEIVDASAGSYSGYARGTVQGGGVGIVLTNTYEGAGLVGQTTWM